MDLDAFTKEILQLKDKIHSLVVEELDQTGEPKARYAEAKKLAEKLDEFKTHLEDVPEKKRPFFKALIYQIDPDVTFLTYSANKAEAVPEPSVNPFAVIRQFSDEVFALAKAVLEKKVPLSEATPQVREFDARFKEIATLPGHEDPEMQRLLSESDLELTWIYNGGKGPTSLRLNRLMD